MRPRPLRAAPYLLALVAPLALGGCSSGRRNAGPDEYEDVPAFDATGDSGFNFGTSGPGGGGVRPVGGPDAFIGDGALRCGGMVRSLTQSRAEVLLVVDTSGSMNELTSDGQRKWTALVDGFRRVLPGVERRLSLGLLQYPAPGRASTIESACSVSSNLLVSFSFGNSRAVLNELAEVTPIGATPTAAALQRAYDLLQSIPDSVGRRYLVLATDGAPNCNPSLVPTGCRCTGAAGNCDPGRNPDAASSCLDDIRTLGVLRTLASRGVQTFVMGLAGTGSLTDVLDAMAVAGGRPRAGRPRYYSAESAAAITTALSAITSGVADCFFDLDSAPPDPEMVDVRIGSMSIPRDQFRRNGWYWVAGSNNRRIEFYGATCDRVRGGSGGETLVAAFGCQAAPAPP